MCVSLHFEYILQADRILTYIGHCYLVFKRPYHPPESTGTIVAKTIVNLPDPTIANISVMGLMALRYLSSRTDSGGSLKADVIIKLP